MTGNETEPILSHGNETGIISAKILASRLTMIFLV